MVMGVKQPRVVVAGSSSSCRQAEKAEVAMAAVQAVLMVEVVGSSSS
jgi:hypothetical protein